MTDKERYNSWVANMPEKERIAWINRMKEFSDKYKKEMKITKIKIINKLFNRKIRYKKKYDI